MIKYVMCEGNIHVEHDKALLMAYMPLEDTVRFLYPVVPENLTFSLH